MKNKLASFLMIFGFLFLLNVPLIVAAQTWQPGQQIVVCKGGKTPSGQSLECGWDDLIILINRVVSFLLYLATILAVFAFIYAGFRMMFAGGNESVVKEAKSMFFNVAVGLIIAYAAWILVYFITSSLKVKPDFELLTML